MMKRILFVLCFFQASNCWAAYSPGTYIVDSTGANAVAVKAASTAAGATDPSFVVALSPNSNGVVINSSALPAGASTSALQTTGNTSLASILAALPSSLGQKTMANSLACTLASDQSAVPASQSGAWNITNITGTVSLPTGAATSALQTTGNTALTTINTTLGSPFQAGGSIGNTSFGISGTLPAFTAIPTFKIDQTTPGTTNGVQVNAALPAGTNLIGKCGIDQTTPGTTNGVQVNAALPAGTNNIGKVQTLSPLNSTGSGSAAAATVSTVITLTAPANAVGAFLMNIDTSTANIRWAVNRTATATLGQQLQPGRDVWIPTTTNISLVAESGTQTYDVQWISQ